MTNSNLTTVERIHLWCYDASKNSDKVYNIELQHNPFTDKYSVYFEHGRRDKSLRPGFKVEAVDYASAKVVMNQLSHKKQYNNRSQYDLISHETDLQSINPAPYVKQAGNLQRLGVLTSNEHERIVNFLLSGDPETVTLAIDILSARKSKMASAA